MTALRRQIGIILSVAILSTQIMYCPRVQAVEPPTADPDADVMPLAGVQPVVPASSPVAIAQATAPAQLGLTPGAREAARLLGIERQVDRLIEIRRARGPQSPDSLTDEELALKVDVFDRILGASLEIRMVTGRIDRELGWAYAGLGMMQGKKQRLINNIVTANFMQIGILGVLSGPAFLHGKPTLGTELLLIASCLGLTFSTAAFLVNRTQGRKPVDGGTTVLADVFHLQKPTPDKHRADIVAAYMNAVPAGSVGNQTRIQELIENWKKGRYLRAQNSEVQLQKLSAIQPADKKLYENIRILNNRVRMLFDTQHMIQTLDADLLELLRATNLG